MSTMRTKRILVAGALLFLIYQYFRVFMISVSWAPPNEPMTFLDKDDRGTFDITFFRDHRFLTRSDYENGSCLRAGRARGIMARRVLWRLHYLDCPVLVKFQFPAEGLDLACIELETVKEEGKGCTPPNALARMANPSVFYRIMGFVEDGSGLYDMGSRLPRVRDPDLKRLTTTVDRLVPLDHSDERSNGNVDRTAR